MVNHRWAENKNIKESRIHVLYCVRPPWPQQIQVIDPIKKKHLYFYRRQTKLQEGCF